MLPAYAAIRSLLFVGVLVAMAMQDPTRPWMQGTVEIACSRDGQPWNGDPSAKEWHRCGCQHTCIKPGEEPQEGDHPDETGGRRWDARCEARCSPSHCHCPVKCGQTD